VQNNLGSSIGVEVANNLEELKLSLDYIFKYDQEIIIEKYIRNRKEYNISLFMDKQNVELSMIEEVKGEDILSYENKYLEKKQGLAGCDRICPALVKNNLKKKISHINYFSSTLFKITMSDIY
jgi:D-alanine-D-alanine ligase